MPNIVISNILAVLPRPLALEGRRNVRIEIAEEVGGICSGDPLFLYSFFCFHRYQEYLPPPRPFLSELSICCGSLWCQVKDFRELVTTGRKPDSQHGLASVYHKPMSTILHVVRPSTPCVLYVNLVGVQFLYVILYSCFIHFVLP